MDHAASLILIDSDTRRRASMSHALSHDHIHVEPFESLAELSKSWPRSGIIMIHDDPGAISDLIEHMARAAEWFPVVAFKESPRTADIVMAVANGAIDYLAWPFTPDELSTVLTRVIGRAEDIGNAKLREAMARNRIEKLTQREREVLSGISNGLSNRLIAEKLSISPRTVEIHRANMLNKLGANHSSEAIRVAIEAEM